MRYVIRKKLAEMNLLEVEGDTLDPDTVREMCRDFATAWREECPECMESDSRFWSSAPAQRLLMILSTAVAMKMETYIPLEELEQNIYSSVRLTREAVEACEDGLREGWFGAVLEEG